jgi:ribosomal protein S18 acetylase RimI-like enzyme
MDLVRITGQHPYLTPIHGWYEASFPPEERRQFGKLLQLLPHPDMHLCALVQAGQPVGFIIYWQWPDAGELFIEHFAIDPDRRGQQLGQQALAQVLHIPAAYYLLEAELPTDDLSKRRIQFYERQGFQVNDFPYAQPPYQPGNPPIPMKLLSQPVIHAQAAFNKLSRLIEERVYRQFYH